MPSHPEHAVFCLAGSLAGLHYEVRDGQSWKDLMGDLVPYFRGESDNPMGEGWAGLEPRALIAHCWESMLTVGLWLSALCAVRPQNLWHMSCET